MTTVFTRLFASEKSTAPLISRMQRAGIPTHVSDVSVCGTALRFS